MFGRQVLGFGILCYTRFTVYGLGFRVWGSLPPPPYPKRGFWICRVNTRLTISDWGFDLGCRVWGLGLFWSRRVVSDPPRYDI